MTERCNKGILTMCVGLIINIGLSLLKLYIGITSYSIAILSDAVNNLIDGLSCGIAIFSFAFMKKGKTETLPYGYGRLEYIASFIMSLLVILVGGYFAYSALERMFYPFFLNFSWLSFGLIAGTVAVKFALGFYYRYKNKIIDSDILRTGSIDSFMDAGITAMTLIGYSLTRVNALRIDAIFGLIISAIIIYSGVKLFIANARTLLGKNLEKDKVEDIKQICSQYEFIEKVTSANIHNYGANYVELILEVVLTDNVKFDIIKLELESLKDKINTKYKVETKICISR